MTTMTEAATVVRRLRRHHVFVFRHCLESVTSEINLFDGETLQGTKYPTDLSDYMNVSLPAWETPVEDCTPFGERHMKAVGRHVMEDYLSSPGEPQKIHVAVISDTPNRNVQSSLKLAQGLDAAKQSTQTLVGLHNLIYDETLFHPAKHNDDPDVSQGSTTQLCSTDAIDNNDDAWNDDISKRLQSVSRPNLLTLADAVTKFETLVGIGSTSLSSILNLVDESLNTALHRVKGPVNAVAALGQTMYYSKACNRTDFLNNISMDDLEAFLAWHHWLSSVLDVANIKVAMQGAVLMHRVLQQLQGNAASNNDIDDDVTDIVTIFMGQQESINAIATAVDFTWLPPHPPLLTKGATPPASALYFLYQPATPETRDSAPLGPQLDIRVLTPVLVEIVQVTNDNDGDGDGTIISNMVMATAKEDSGKLLSTAVEFGGDGGGDNLAAQAQMAEDGAVTRISGNAQNNNDPLQALQARVIQVLTNNYAAPALQCYQAAQVRYPSTDDNDDDTSTMPTTTPTTMTTEEPSPSPVSSENGEFPTASPTATNDNGGPTTATPTESSNGSGYSPPPTPAPQNRQPHTTKHPTNEYHPAQQPTWPPHKQYGNGSTSSKGNNFTTMNGGSSPVVVGLVVAIVLAGLIVLFRKPIMRGLGLGQGAYGRRGRPIQYSGMDARDLDFSVEMI